jgi:hypothetical protein
MPFTEGHKLGKGKQKGTVHKTTKDVKLVIANALELTSDKVMEELNKLEGRNFLDVWVKLAEFITPKMKAVEMKDISDNKPPLIIEKYIDTNE